MVKESGGGKGGGVNYNYIGGNLLSKAAPGEEIVISGLSGAFPNANNVDEYRDHLFNKEDMVTKNRRWDLNHPEIPKKSGTIPEINKYDTGYFGVHERQAETMDPMIRILQEKTIEAIFDAGLHPSDFVNTKTGVFIGICFSETERASFLENLEPERYGWTGAARSMAARRISYFLKLKGPSYTLDTACSSSLYAVEHAFKAIRLGEIDCAIVGAANLCLNPLVTLQFSRLGVLSKDGTCKVFDELGNGYARSESISIVILQKAKYAKRIYAEILYAKTNCDGYKEEGINFPSGNVQKKLLFEVYEECNIDRSSLSFLETHGTGTFVGDPEECSAIDESLTINRKTPLLIGSVKSNIGHSEAASGLCSLIKCVVGMQAGLIPPNIHYNKPRDSIKGIIEGRLKVVSDTIPFEDDRGLVGVNSFGFGGGNCHVLLRWNKKSKVNDGLPKDNLPRLVCISGRSKEAVASLLDDVTGNKLDTEYIKLLHEAFRKNVDDHLYRGYTIVEKSGEITRSIKYSPAKYKKLYFGFGEITNLYDVGKQLMVFPLFANTLKKVQKWAAYKGISNILADNSPVIEHSILSNVAIHIGIIEILNLLEIRPDGCLGCPFGELLSAYCHGFLTLEETINCAIIINQCVVNGNALYKCNGDNHQEINNPNQLIRNGIPSNNETSTLLDNIRTSLKTKTSAIKNHLQQNLPKELRTDKQRNGNPANKKYKSVNDFINILMNSLIEDSQCDNSIILQIGNSQIRGDDAYVIPIYKSTTNNNYLLELLKGIGSLYECGYNPQVMKLYPAVELPVSRGTRTISPHIKWRHDTKWFVPDKNADVKKHAATAVTIRYEDYIGHVIDGRNLLPATGYLYLVWETFAILQGLTMSDMRIGFANCRFLRATNIPTKGRLILHITIQKYSGHFEVTEGESAVVTGQIYLPEENEDLNSCDQSIDFTNDVGPSLKTKDVYKELRLRGYNYKGDFRAIQECDCSASKALIKWNDNWVTFIDNMLQMKILEADTRSLYVPTYIAKLVIDAKRHYNWINMEYINKEKAPILPVFNNRVSGIVSCGGIHLNGLIANPIPRRKYLGTPVLEKYEFVPNIASLSTEESIRINMQIILENAVTYKVKAVELIDEFSKNDAVPLIPIIHSVLGDIPLIQPSLKILSKTPLELDFEVGDQTLASETDCLLVIASDILTRPQILKEAFASLKENGFIISRESTKFDPSSCDNPNITILTMHRTPTETVLLIQKPSPVTHRSCVKINSDPNDFSWISRLQDAKKTFNENVMIYSENEPNSGIIGLVNCLRREPGSANNRCMFVVDKTEKFDIKDSFYYNQLKKNMAVNVYKNGEWGTYRHFLIDDTSITESEHRYVNVTVRGDLSSLRWIKGPLRHDTIVPPGKLIIKVHYAGLNFRDIMTALGKISADVVAKRRIDQMCVQGFEFAGIDKSGKRVMGMTTHGALSTLLVVDPNAIHDVPDSWSLEEAASVSVIYSTVIYAIKMRADIKKGESILIHSGTGGIGQAAIRLALRYGCEVFTTVGSQEKRDFLKQNYPQLKDHHIGNSRDESFEEMILRETNGRGVDVVLNSLAEEKLLVSVRCLARGGRFVEIGKYDLANNNEFNSMLLQRDGSFHGVMLDMVMVDQPDIRAEIARILKEEIKSGAIKPLNRVVFKASEIEQAFRFMASGKHMGKVVIQVRDSEMEPTSLSLIEKFPCNPMYLCDPERSYIIVGGLGGFGLELADWLIINGARKLVLTSRKGVTTGYQNYRIRIWKSYGTVTKISTADVTTKDGCKQLLKESLELGPVSAIFNLAVVLADALFENQTPESFLTSFGPKANATAYLDEISRIMCPDLSEFVVFSSVSCGKGNAGQTNYGMANSVMERICEKRKQDGLPAIAIQWGAVGEVGLIAEMQEEQVELEIGGTLQQRISSCLQVLGLFLRKNDTAVVSSMVVAEKRSKIGDANNPVDAVLNILGVTDVKSISFHSTLAELGMDSMTAVEIKQTLEREFEIFLTAKDMRTMTLQKLKEIQEEANNKADEKTETPEMVGIEAILRLVGKEADSNTSYMVLKSNIDEPSKAPKLIMFPGLEGFASVYESLASRLNAHVVCMQFIYDTCNQTVVDIAQSLLPSVKEHLKEGEPFNIVAYSYGTVIALEIVGILESQGYTGTIFFLDGSPLLFKEMLSNAHVESESLFQTGLMCQLMSLYLPPEVVSKHKEYLFSCKSWDERLNYAIKVSQHRFGHEENYQRIVANGIYGRVKGLMSYIPTYGKLRSNAKLYKPTRPTVSGIVADYNLSEIFEKPLEVLTFEGNHVTILENNVLADTINESIH